MQTTTTDQTKPNHKNSSRIQLSHTTIAISYSFSFYVSFFAALLRFEMGIETIQLAYKQCFNVVGVL